MRTENVLGLIAGQGRLPFLVAEGAKRAGLRVVCVGLADSANPALADEVDVFYSVPLARPGTWIRKLRNNGVTSTIMVGRVAKTRIYTPWRILKYLPDWRGFRIWYWRLRAKDKLDDSLLSALADELATGGIILENSMMYCTEHMATEGVMTKRKPAATLQADIDFGWPIVKKLGELDIGQAVVVKEREVIAVEAIEGTAAMLERAGKCCKAGKWTLIKAAKPNQDQRFDVPCIGPETIKAVADNGGACIVVEAETTMIIDKPQTLALADELGIVVVGVESSNKQSGGKVS
jgi:DUF1009 family protein